MLTPQIHTGMLLSPRPYSFSSLYLSPTSSTSCTCPIHPVPAAIAVPFKLRLKCLTEAAEAAAEATELTARERRQLRQQRREANDSNWREQVEDRLLLEAKTKKKAKPSRAAQLSVNGLLELGPQWWALRVSRTRAREITTRLTHALSTNFPEVEFKVYNPSVRESRKLKDGTIRIKHRPIVPGTMYLHCKLNRQVHDFLKTCPGVQGFLGSQIEANKEEYFVKPRPIDADEIEAILQQEKEEQEIVDNKALKEKEAGGKKSLRRNNLNQAYLLPGVNVRVLSGPFADYTGCLKEIDLKKQKATVHVVLFGKETSVELDIDQIDAVIA
ncbi:Transcription termination/antitermination protein NusG [Rhynchospora pubera]|uniref:Transcription termination/antitermination protein NusG n=1 Tax=Rhynchospora pubera TaxID=906938 RepID=A0AAV8BVK6_9POAL|nr:Transcription termination/antitermination protein NusG [Rhynchospora pubera]